MCHIIASFLLLFDLKIAIPYLSRVTFEPVKSGKNSETKTSVVKRKFEETIRKKLPQSSKGNEV
jgi:hypothetical protein